VPIAWLSTRFTVALAGFGRLCPTLRSLIWEGRTFEGGALRQARWSGGGLRAVRCWSGGGLMWITQSPNIERLTTLAIRLWVRLSPPCIDGAGTVRARRVPDVDYVRYWNRVIYVINSRGRRGAHYVLINRSLGACWQGLAMSRKLRIEYSGAGRFEGAIEVAQGFLERAPVTARSPASLAD